MPDLPGGQPERVRIEDTLYQLLDIECVCSDSRIIIRQTDVVLGIGSGDSNVAGLHSVVFQGECSELSRQRGTGITVPAARIVVFIEHTLSVGPVNDPLFIVVHHRH